MACVPYAAATSIDVGHDGWRQGQEIVGGALLS